ncbi:hypothetical protein [Geodermatophilus sp. SYSU D00815]
MNARRRAVVRGTSATLAAAGVGLLARPREAVGLAAPDEPEPPLGVVRLLGGRMLAQHVVVAVLPTRPAVLGWAVVDGLHALSMVPVAVRWPAHRRLAAASAAVSAASVLLAAALVYPWSAADAARRTRSS